MKTEEFQGQNIQVCRIKAGRNPRQHFDEKSMTELEDSIRAMGGLLTPILVRRDADDFQLIAGERRLRAWRKVYGDEAFIPAMIKDMEDELADAAALTENIAREPMTPLEEAEAAAKILGDCKGDRAEAATRMGWSVTTLDKRLALMYAIEPVRLALHQKKILLGHAELLAVCRKETQVSALAMLLSSQKQMTVEAFKDVINSAALVLDSAIFNKDQCAGCVHNSGNQSALFAQVINGGRCTNKQCYDEKTEAELAGRANALREEFQNVRVVRPGENFTVIPLVAEGAKGVGIEQAQACRACQNFGAVVAAAPDKLGKVFKNLCMDVPCNTTMVAKRVSDEVAAAKAAEAAKLTQQAANQVTAPASPGTRESGAAAGKGATPPGKDSGKEKDKKVVYPEPSNRVKEYREELWRSVFKRVVTNASLVNNRAVLLAICLTHPGHLDAQGLGTDLNAILGGGSSHSFGKVLATVLDLREQDLGQAISAIAGNVRSGPMGMGIEDVVSALKALEVKLADHWKVDKGFFEKLTKNEIDVVAGELGIAAAMDKEYAKARALGKEDFIKAILEVKGFEYRGRIPKLVSW